MTTGMGGRQGGLLPPLGKKSADAQVYTLNIDHLWTTTTFFWSRVRLYSQTCEKEAVVHMWSLFWGRFKMYIWPVFLCQRIVLSADCLSADCLSADRLSADCRSSTDCRNTITNITVHQCCLFPLKKHISKLKKKKNVFIWIVMITFIVFLKNITIQWFLNAFFQGSQNSLKVWNSIFF